MSAQPTGTLTPLQRAEVRLEWAEHQLLEGQRLYRRLADPETTPDQKRAIEQRLARQCALIRDTLEQAADLARLGGGL